MRFSDGTKQKHQQQRPFVLGGASFCTAGRVRLHLNWSWLVFLDTCHHLRLRRRTLVGEILGVSGAGNIDHVSIHTLSEKTIKEQANKTKHTESWRKSCNEPPTPRIKVCNISAAAKTWLCSSVYSWVAGGGARRMIEWNAQLLICKHILEGADTV